MTHPPQSATQASKQSIPTPLVSPHTTQHNKPQIVLPDDLPDLALLMLAGGAGIYAGSHISTHVDMALFRRLLVFLLLLGANVMLFAGAPARVALGGVASIMAGIVLYILALWNQPVWPLGAGEGGKGRSGGGSSLLQRWLGGALYSQVAVDEGEEDEEEGEMVVDFREKQQQQGGGDGGIGKGGGEVELTGSTSRQIQV